jgi:hypothetical protein
MSHRRRRRRILRRCRADQVRRPAAPARKQHPSVRLPSANYHRLDPVIQITSRSPGMFILCCLACDVGDRAMRRVVRLTMLVG